MSNMKNCGDVTELLNELNQGKGDALNALIPQVMDDLKVIARKLFSKERAGHTLSTMGLVNELYIKLVGQKAINLKSRTQFFSAATILMRRILVDHARKHRADKRGNEHRVPNKTGWSAAAESGILSPEELLAINDALERLREQDPKQAFVVDLKYFMGLTNDEAAEVLEVSEKTIRREWYMAKAWLKRELREH